MILPTRISLSPALGLIFINDAEETNAGGRIIVCLKCTASSQPEREAGPETYSRVSVFLLKTGMSSLPMEESVTT